MQLGIDLDAGTEQADRWLMAATLFGTRIPASVALRTYPTMAGSAVRTIEDVGRRTGGELVDLLDHGGYVRHDYKTASRLLDYCGDRGGSLSAGLQVLLRLEPNQLATSAACATGVA
jgi:hypothetical protein